MRRARPLPRVLSLPFAFAYGVALVVAVGFATLADRVEGVRA